VQPCVFAIPAVTACATLSIGQPVSLSKPVTLLSVIAYPSFADDQSSNIYRSSTSSMYPGVCETLELIVVTLSSSQDDKGEIERKKNTFSI